MKKIVFKLLVFILAISACYLYSAHADESSNYSMTGLNPQHNYCIIDDVYKFKNRLAKHDEYEIGNNTSIDRVYYALDNYVILRIGKSPFNGIICYDTVERKVKWELDVNNGYPVAIYNKKLYVTSDEEVRCIDLNTGVTFWSFEKINKCGVTVDDNNVFLSYPDEVTCLDQNTGDKKWEAKIENLYFPYTINLSEPSIAINNNKAIYYHYGVTCLDTTDGEILWQTAPYVGHKDPFNYLVGATGMDVSISGNTIIAVSQLELGFVALDINDGSILWETYGSNAPIAVSNSHNIFTSTGFACFDLSNGERKWLVDLKYVYDFDSYNTLIINDNLISFGATDNYPGTDDFTINNRSIDDGTLLWRHIFSGDAGSLGTISNGFLYFEQNGLLLRYGEAADSLTFRINSNTYKPDNDGVAEMDSEPIILQDRTYLPARYVTEPLGGQVFWDASERKVTCKLVAPDNAETEEYKENVVELWIGKSTAKLNGVEVQIDPNNPDVVPTITNDRTMVPMRFLAESLGCDVEWLATTKEIILTYTP